jgi:FAD/FMN-containing dehydrogenase
LTIRPDRASKRACAAGSGARWLFDAFSRGRYATDASIYQIEPLGVVVPKNREDAAAAIAIAREEGVPVLPRGGGTSQCGQTVARALVIDCSKHLDRVISVEIEGRRARVEPGVVLDRLNRLLRKDKLFFPVDPSNGEPGHDRRHDCQQQLRLALAALWQHGAQRPRHRRVARRRHLGVVRRGPR